MSARHERATQVYGTPSQERLDGLRVSFVGLGGLGMEVAALLRRISSADLVLIDPDRVEVSNLPRLAGLDDSAVGRYKAEVAAELLRRVDATALGLVALVEDVDDAVIFDADIVIVTADGAGPRADVAIRARRSGFRGLVIFAAARIDADHGPTARPRTLGRVSVQGREAPWCVLCAGIVDPTDAALALDVPREAVIPAGYGNAATTASVAWWNAAVAARTVRLIHEHAAGLSDLDSLGLDIYLNGEEQLLVEHDPGGVPSCPLCAAVAAHGPNQGSATVTTASPPTRG